MPTRTSIIVESEIGTGGNTTDLGTVNTATINTLNGDIINFNSKAKRLANFADNNGIFRYYSSGNKILKCSEQNARKSANYSF